MHISSARLGHANNSSSTHSILLNSKSAPRASEHGEFEFGWDWFHIKDHDGKARYLSALVYTTLRHDMADDHAAVVAKDLTGFNPIRDRIEGGRDDNAYVDHQSVNAFPLSFGAEKYDPEFMRDFVTYVRDNPKVSIRGGNDNCEEGDNWVEGEDHAVNALPRDCGKVKLFARKDGQWWVLYNKDSGAKVRVSFAKNPGEYLKATKPELVDVKITNWCKYGCKFCYMDSDEKGKHADVKVIEQVAWACHAAKVFEVALGGGETTDHPQFKEILEKFALNGITPNFTTFNMNWATDEVKRKAVEEHCRSFAMSNPNELKRLALWNDKHKEGFEKGLLGTFQLALGCHDEKIARKALDGAAALGIPVTLLGFKDHGRGKNFDVKDYGWILDYITNLDNWQKFGADSVFVGQFGDALKARGVHEKLMVNTEGAFSCFIDAVEKKMGASSYTDELHLLDEKAIFQKFPYAA